LSVVVTVLGLVLIALAVCSATIWKPSSKVEAKLASGPSQPYVMTAPGVLSGTESDIAVTSKSSDGKDVHLFIARAADVDAENVRELPVEGDVLPGTIEVTGEVSWEDVAALLVDEPEAQDDVRAARLGDEDAFERAAEADLLWYDVTEREALAESLGV